MTDMASCLIKTRLYQIGFPERFQYYPSDMAQDTVDKLHAMALEVMNHPVEITSPDRLERCVIVLDEYIVLGASGFLKDLIPGLAAEYSNFCDASETRKVYGFFAFVWNRKTASALPKAFPSAREFEALVKELILPHWRKQDYSLEGEQMRRGIKTEYRFSLSEHAEQQPSSAAPQLNSDHARCEVQYTDDAEGVMSAALRALRPLDRVSVRTGSYRTRDVETLFDNWLVPRAEYRGETLAIKRKEMKNARTAAPKKTEAPQAREPRKEQDRAGRRPPLREEKEPPQETRKPAREKKQPPQASGLSNIIFIFPNVARFTENDMAAIATLVSNSLQGNVMEYGIVEEGVYVRVCIQDSPWTPGMEEDLLMQMQGMIVEKQNRGMFLWVNPEEIYCEILTSGGVLESLGRNLREILNEGVRTITSFFGGSQEEEAAPEIKPPLPEIRTPTAQPEISGGSSPEKKAAQEDNSPPPPKEPPEDPFNF